jgi:hypothetical protein
LDTICAPHFLQNGIHRPNGQSEVAAAGFGHLRHWTAEI